MEIARQFRDVERQVVTLNNLGAAYGSLGKYNEAINYFKQSLEITTEYQDRKLSLDNIDRVYRYLGNYEKVIEYQLQSLEIERKIRDRQSESKTLSNLGIAHFYLGNYEKAIDYQLQSLEIARELKNRQVEKTALGNLGVAHQFLAKYDKAIEYALQSLAIARELKSREGEAASLANLGIAYIKLGKYDEAIKYQKQSLDISRNLKNREDEGKALGNLSTIYRNRGEYDKAIEYQLQSLAISQKFNDRQGEGRSLAALGTIYRDLGKYDKAIEYQLQSLLIAKELKDRQGEGQSLSILGIVYQDLGKYDKAIDYYRQSLVIAREIKDRASEGISFNNIGALFTKQNQSDLAILFYKQSINVTESIRKDIRKLNKEEQRSYVETVSSSYKSLASLLLNQGRIMEALQVLDLLKVQELEDYFKNIKGSDRSAQGVRLLEPEKAISDKLGAISFENSPEINSQLANKIQQLPKSEINKVPDYLQKIPQGTALLYPLILGDRLEIILFTPNTIPISRTVKISKENLEELINDFVKGLRDSGSEDHKEPAAELYKLLIKPIEAELIQAKTTTILYAPDGILRYIPLAAFYDGKQWLAEKYRINNLIAYSLFDFAPNLKTQPNILAGAFGGKKGERKFGQNALPATLIEVQAIANSFQNSVTLIEDQFSRKAIESKFQDHNILHLATHAQFNTGTPDNSFIIFGNGDKIKLNEITDWQIPNIDLIVLSACETGTSTLGNGVEILGFGYQIQKAGAKNAIASLWKVNDEGTQVLMEAFYGELKKGDLSSTEALHRAQVALIKSPKYNHPFYWSAFFAIGNGL